MIAICAKSVKCSSQKNDCPCKPHFREEHIWTYVVARTWKQNGTCFILSSK